MLDGDLFPTVGRSGPGYGRKPLGGDAFHIHPAADVLRWDAEILSEIGNAPCVDEFDICHVETDDTFRVDRQHYARHDSCEASGMTPGDRLRELRLRANLSVEQLAARLEKAASSVRAHENGQNGIKPAVAAQYAIALGVSPEAILFGTGRSAAPSASAPEVSGERKVPIMGVVQAGAWAEIPTEDPEPSEFVVFDEPEYARARAFALIVRGSSTNLVYPDGCRVICIPAIEAGVRDGDFVVVRRRRGAFSETTLKQLVMGDRGVELWPRSSDPAFQEPLLLHHARDADDNPEIVAVVVARYEVGRSGRGPLLEIA